MKRRNRIVALLAAMVLMVGMLPATAAAADVYRLTVTIADSGSGATGERVTDSTGYLTGDTNLVATVGALVASNYYLSDGSVNPASPLRAFRSDAMRQKLRVKVKMFLGREMQIEVDLDQVEKKTDA